MDVKCERCSTEYEFDDALVSGRGTTVKCTNCGYKFKIRRGDGDYSEDFWNVTAGDGRTLVFTSLRELQRAIQSYLVDRHDRLSRGGLPPKPIGEIPELAPFFEQRERRSGRPQKTQDGLGPHVPASEPVPASRPRQATKPEFPAPPSDDGTPGSGDYGSKRTLIGTGPQTAQPAFDPTPMQGSAVARPPSVPPSTERQGSPPVHAEPAPRAHVSAPPPLPARRDSSNTVPIKRSTIPPVPAAASMPPPLPALPTRASDPGVQRLSEPIARATSHRPSAPRVPAAPSVPPPLPARARASIDPPRQPLMSELEEDSVRDGASAFSEVAPPRRRSAAGTVAIAVMVGGVVLLGAAWAKKNYGGAEAKPTAPALAVDPRVAGFLASGEKALAEGNLELAKESFDKASALAETDPHVLLGLARLAAIRADAAWLKVRLLPPEAADEERATRDALGDLAATARNAADAAIGVAPNDVGALRAKTDAARISGDRGGARAAVGKIASSASDPETAYVLAALDLTEPEPSWPSVVDRLKTAAAAEHGPGRARAALVYALARSGDVATAKTELQRLASMPKPHPLLPQLRAFTDRTKGGPVASASAAAPSASAAATVEREGREGKAGTHRGDHGASTAAGPIPTDSRELLSQGERARSKGDYERARTLFTAAVDKNPNDSEALAGLGAIAYAQHDLNGARSAYKRVVAINPNYMPAVVGLADVEWDAGDRATATRMYKDIVDRYPEGAYPARVKQRSEGGG